jgi:hypothetical protein
MRGFHGPERRTCDGERQREELREFTRKLSVKHCLPFCWTNLYFTEALGGLEEGYYISILGVLTSRYLTQQQNRGILT